MHMTILNAANHAVYDFICTLSNSPYFFACLMS